MAGEGLLSLRWNNHRTSFMQVLSSLWDKHKYSDVTLACAGKFYSVHKFVLSTCSDYFLDIVENTPCTHPTIVLKDIRAQDLEALLNYMYLGEVNVLQTDLSRLIKAAECLRIKGLAVPDESPPQYPDESRVGGQDEATPQTKRRRNDDDSTNSLPSPQRKKRNARPHSVEPGDSACSRDQEGDSEGSGRESHDHHDTISHLNTSPTTTVRDTHQVQSNFCEARIKTEEEEEEEEVKCEDEAGEASEACLAALEVHLSHSDPPLANQGKYDPQQALPGPSLLPQPYPSQPQSFEEIVSQALPGPSGLQGDGSGWDGSRVKGDIAPFHLQGFTQQMGSLGRTSRHPCHFCHKEFAFASDLERHMRIHTGEKPFACPLCPYRSSQRYNLLRHRRVHMIKAVSEWHPQPPSPLAVKAGEWSQPPSPPLVVKVSESRPHSPTPPQSSPVPP